MDLAKILGRKLPPSGNNLFKFELLEMSWCLSFAVAGLSKKGRR